MSTESEHVRESELSERPPRGKGGSSCHVVVLPRDGGPGPLCETSRYCPCMPEIDRLGGLGLAPSSSARPRPSSCSVFGARIAFVRSSSFFTRMTIHPLLRLCPFSSTSTPSLSSAVSLDSSSSSPGSECLRCWCSECPPSSPSSDVASIECYLVHLSFGDSTAARWRCDGECRQSGEPVCPVCLAGASRTAARPH